MPNSSCMRATCAQTPSRAMGSRPTVGSSRISSDGRFTSACASSSRRTMPPEYVPARFVGDVEQLHRVQRLVDPVAALPTRHVVEPGEQVDVLPARQRGLDRELLWHIADVVPDVHGVAPGVEAEDRTPRRPARASAWSAPAPPWSCPHRWVRAGPPSRRRAPEGQVVDRGEVAVAVGQVLAVDRERRVVMACLLVQHVGSLGQHRPMPSLKVGRSGRGPGDRAPPPVRRGARRGTRRRCAGRIR